MGDVEKGRDGSSSEQAEPNGQRRTSRMASLSLIFGAVALLSAPVGRIVVELTPDTCRPSPAVVVYIVCIGSFFPLVGSPVAGLTGILALASIWIKSGRLAGRGRAIAGILLGILAFWLFVLCTPNLVRSRKMVNESATWGSLKTIVTQQAVFKTNKELDQDKDGIGEYGLLGELCGELPLRAGTTRTVSPIYISQQFETRGTAGTGYATKSGYHFRIFLAASRTTAGDDALLARKPDGEAGRPVAPEVIDLQEKYFVVYAWPVEYCRTGARAFVVGNNDQIYSTKMEAKVYSGPNGPSVESAFGRDGDPSDGWLNDKLGGTHCNDGNEWQAEPY